MSNKTLIVTFTVNRSFQSFINIKGGIMLTNIDSFSKLNSCNEHAYLDKKTYDDAKKAIEDGYGVEILLCCTK